MKTFAFIYIVSSIFLAPLCPAQQPSVIQNPSALVSRMITASGWSNPPTDVLAYGNVHSGEDLTGTGASLVVSMRGANATRYETTVDSEITVVVSNGVAAARTRLGISKSLPIFYATSARKPIFPALSLVPVPNANKAFRYIRSEIISSELTDVVETTPILNDLTDQTTAYKRIAQTYRLWISRQSGLLLQISYVQIGAGNPEARRQYLRRFSNYQSFAGRLFALHQEEFLNGELDTISDFTTVRFDSAIPDSAFAVPVSTMGSN